MTLEQYLGYPLSAALDALRRANMPEPGIQYTLSPKRREMDAATRATFTARVVGVSEYTFIVSIFRDGQPPEKEQAEKT